MAPLPKFEDFKAPWEMNGEETPIDPAKLKKHLYNLMTDKERLQNTVAEKDTEIGTLKNKVDEYESKDLSEMEKLRRENEKLKEGSKPDPSLALENARLQLAIDHGLTVAQAKRLSGATKEELEADVETLKADLGLTKRQEQPGESDNRPPFGSFRTGNDDGEPPVETNPAKLTDLV